jgi:diguanylate cyclase (GGDEF)-like protein
MGIPAHVARPASVRIGARGWAALPLLLPLSVPPLSCRLRRFFASPALRWWSAAMLAAGMLASATAAAPANPAPRRWTELTEAAFQHLTQDNGLPNEIAMAVAEDGQGFVWVGTLGGLARWDGYRFRVYKADPHTEGALPDNYIQTLHGDAAGRLWVGTSAAGLVRYDPQQDRFVAYPVGVNGLSHVSVRAVEDDGDGGLWVGTDGGLDHLDPASGAITHAAPGSPAGAGLAGARAPALLRDSAGRLWVGTSAGLFRRDPGDDRFVPVPLPGGGPAQPEPLCLTEDSQGRLWVGSLRHGAFVLDARGGTPARAVHEIDPRDGIDLLHQQQVVAVVEARPGEMWLGTLTEGIVAMDLAQSQSRRIRNVPTWGPSLAANALRHLHRDRSGLVWVSTNRGVSRQDPRQGAILTRFGAVGGMAGSAERNSTEVSWIQPMPGGRVWLGTHKGAVDVLDATGARVASLPADASRPDRALPQDIVLGMARADDGSVFIGTKRGLFRASQDGRQVARVEFAGRDPAASTWALLADADTLWIGGQTDGLWRLDLRSGAGTAMLRDPDQRLTDQRVIVIERGAHGTLWVGTRYGLNQVDPQRGVLARYLPEPGAAQGLSAGFVTALHTDSQQRLWVGTYGGGIDVLTLADAPAGSGAMVRLGAGQGLPDNNVNAMLEDRQGRLWVSTDNGLAVIDPASLAVRPLRRAEGVMFPTYWTGSAARTPEDELLFGGAGGVTIVRPELLQTWDYHPPVVVTDLQVGGRRLPPAASGELTVPAAANSLAVEFSAIDYSAPERNRYAYKLEGFDPDWVETDASRRLAAYTNLPPGRYRLLLRGSNRDGAWSEQPLALSIRVLPAWHQTLWFRAGAALATLLVLAAVVQARTRLLRARQTELERKVGERTAELRALHQTLKEKSAVLERTSITDPLTGLHNRRFLTEHIDTDIAASQRRALDLQAGGGGAVDTDSVFFLIDIDHFKRVNDLHGHAAGDAVLVQFSRRLCSVMRESDHLVRWGGEEFLAVARDTDRGRAEELAERIRCVVAESPFTTESGQSLAITCSIGFACLPWLPSRPQALGWQDVIRLADWGLLAAKRIGRNAWVGLHATDAAQPEHLQASMQASPQQALHRGEIRASSSRGVDSVMQALSPAADGTAAWPFSTEPVPG